MKVLDLFSGIGGFSLGFERAGMETVAFCEIDPFCQKILRKHWEGVPIYDDIRTITEQFTGTVDVICGGFPCQPFSVAGKQEGKADDRYLWPEMFNCIRHYKPRWVIGENVTGIISMALDDVLSDLESEGYSCQTFVIPACGVNAPHRRNRVWILAYSASGGRHGRNRKQAVSAKKNQQWVTTESAVTSRCGENGVDAITDKSKFSTGIFDSFGKVREIEPTVCRSDDGIPNRTHRLKALGNAVVPQIPEVIGRAVMKIEKYL